MRTSCSFGCVRDSLHDVDQVVVLYAGSSGVQRNARSWQTASYNESDSEKIRHGRVIQRGEFEWCEDRMIAIANLPRTVAGICRQAILEASAQVATLSEEEQRGIFDAACASVRNIMVTDTLPRFDRALSSSIATTHLV